MKRRAKITSGSLRAFELDGRVDKYCKLHVDEPLPVNGPSQVKVIVLVPDAGEITEKDYLKIATRSPSFEFLKDSAEDIYSKADGKAFRDKR